PLEQAVAAAHSVTDLVQLAESGNYLPDSPQFPEFEQAVQKIHGNDMMAAVEAKLNEGAGAKEEEKKPEGEAAPPASPEEAVEQAADKKADEEDSQPTAE